MANSYKEMDIGEWKRQAAYEFFRDFEDPFFSMTAQVDVTRLRKLCKEKGLSFSVSCLYFSQLVVNSIEEFRMRLIGDELVLFEKVDSTQTILLDNGAFCFCYFEWINDLVAFDRAGREAIDNYSSLASFDVESDRIDLVYYSVIPWVSFTSFKHASRSDNTRTIPRIVFGKWSEVGERSLLPVSVEANHRIMDGYHFGKYFEELQAELDRL